MYNFNVIFIIKNQIELKITHYFQFKQIFLKIDISKYLYHINKL